MASPSAKSTITTANEELQKKVFESVNAKMNELLDKPLSKNEFYGGMDELQAAVVAEIVHRRRCKCPEDKTMSNPHSAKPNTRSSANEF